MISLIKIVPLSTISLVQLVLTTSNWSVRHGKKLQNAEPLFGIIQKGTVIIAVLTARMFTRLETEVQEIKKR